MEKLYNDKGQVAVAVSKGYGAGWSSWSDINPMDKQYNELFLKGDIEAVKELAERNNEFSNGAKNVELIWLDPETKFIIDEYDGSESLRILEKINYYTA